VHRQIAIGLLLAFAALAARAESPGPTPRLELYEDASRRLTLEDVRRDGSRFRPAPEGRLNLGFSASAIWLRLTAQTPLQDRWVLEIATPFLDRVEAHVVAPAPVSAAAGDMLPFVDRAYPHRNLVFPLPASGGGLEAYLRIESAGSLILPIRLLREDALLRRDGPELLALGLYYGLLAALIAYNGFIFASLRDPSYFWYVLYLGSFAGLQLTLSGLAQQIVWPTLANASNAAVVLLLASAEVAGLLFARSFLRAGGRAPRLDRAFLTLAAATALAGAAYAVVGYSTIVRLLILLGLAQIPLIVAAGFLAWRAGFAPARFLLLAFAALAPGAAVYALRALGLLDSTFATDHAIELSTAAEATLLSFALADRIRTLAADKRSVERAARLAQEQFAARLLEAQDAERRRIAAELHDSLGQKLVAIAGRLNGAQSPGAAEASALAVEGVAEVRAIAHNLHPHLLERLGLAAALESMLDETFGAAGIPCGRSIAAVDGLLGPERSIHVYRIAQEAAVNVVRHAAARRCSVELALEGGALVLRVRDDGRGLPPDASGFGLDGLRERARLLGGRLRLAGAPGAGALVELTVPLEDAA